MKWLITPNDGSPEYVLTMPEGEYPADLPPGYTMGPVPVTQTEEEAEAERAARFRGDGSWESPLGLAMKKERNRRLDGAKWATDPDTSPLTEESRAAWCAYVKTLHRLTVDFPGPEAAVWPEEPEKVYS